MTITMIITRIQHDLAEITVKRFSQPVRIIRETIKKSGQPFYGHTRPHLTRMTNK
jgi:hypothetical protein